MQLTVKQQDLARGISTVNHAVSSRSTLPILANILLSTDNGRLKLSATNLEIGINCWIDAEIIEEGTTTVPAKTFSDLVGSLRQDKVELSVPEPEEGKVPTIHIKGQGTQSTIKGMDPSEYPAIPSTEDATEQTTFEAKDLKEMIEQVAFAAATDDSRPVFTGVNVEFSSGQATFAAADAFRLTVRSHEVSHEVPFQTILIPAKTLSELAKILPTDGVVDMVVTPNRSQVLFHTDNVDLVSRLIEGTFPNFRQIIPTLHTTRAVLDTKEFAAAVKTVVPFARDSSNICRVKVTPGATENEQGTLTIEATAEDVGSNVSTISASVEGPDQQSIFNVKYLSDVLSVLDTPEVSLELVNAAKPGVIKPVGGGDYTYVIMPMSTNR
jgi:DNA polymerase III subunit beta